MGVKDIMTGDTTSSIDYLEKCAMGNLCVY